MAGLFGMRAWGDGRRVGWAGWDEGLGDGRSDLSLWGDGVRVGQVG